VGADMQLDTDKCDVLESIIENLDTLYDEGKECRDDNILLQELGFRPVVTDPDYDSLKRILRENRPTSYIFTEVTASKYTTQTNKIKHFPLLTSLEKASHEDLSIQTKQLQEWFKFCGNVPVYRSDYYYEQWKLDGVSIQIYYINGKLSGAGLRPRDGEFGEDVSRQIQYVSGVPKELKLPLTCAIRAELVILKDDFELVQKWKKTINEKPFSNERSAAIGGIRQFKNPELTKHHRITAIAHNIWQEKHIYTTEIEKARFCNDLGFNFVDTISLDFNTFKNAEENAAKLNFRVDGIVIGVNDISIQDKLGRHGDKPSGNPRAKIAWKFREERAIVQVKSIEWSVGRTGVIKPVALFDGVRLGGTTVERATLHNSGFIYRNKIGLRAELTIVKAGNIIPKVISVVSQGDSVVIPKVCPVCGTSVIESEHGEISELRCPNECCTSRQVNRLVHWFAVLGCLGLGEATIFKLVGQKKIYIIEEFYGLTLKSLLEIFTLRESLLILAAIHMIDKPEKLTNEKLTSLINTRYTVKKIIPSWKFLAALGIPNVGTDISKSLLSSLTIEQLIKSDLSTLLSIPGVGTTIAQSIVNFFSKNDITKLLNHFQFINNIGKLSGKLFCLSGSLPNGKKYWQDKIEQQGGICVGTVSSKLTYLVAGDKSGEKSDKAKKIGISIIDTVKLEKLLCY
jgi:DNA ligase (NAD+)